MPAPKGNQYAKGSTTNGRPLKFATVEEFEKKVEEYLNNTPKEEWTITGLAIALDTFRDVLCDYGNGKYDSSDNVFSASVKKAKQMVENSYELDLKKHGRSGTIFALKNFNWKDQTNVDVSGEIALPTRIIIETIGKKEPELIEAEIIKQLQ